MKLFSVIIYCCFLVACSDSDISERVFPAPDLSLSTAQIKTFEFSWDSVDGATHYTLWENIDGKSGFVQVSPAIQSEENTFTLSVPLFARTDAQYVLQTCKPTACVDSSAVGISNNLVESIGYFKASNTDVDDQFGTSVALSRDGKTLAVSAIHEDSDSQGVGGLSNNDGDNSGAVYIFINQDGDWRQQAYIKANNADDKDQFGTSIALSADGNRLAVGAKYEDSDAKGINGDGSNNSRSKSGAVYIFDRGSDVVWSQHSYIKASEPGEEDEFGWQVALSDDGATLAVSAIEEDSNATGVGGDEINDSKTGSGAVYVFALSNQQWTQQAYIKATNTDAEDEFGYALDLSGDGNTLAVGSKGEASDGNQTNNLIPNSGAAYIYTRVGLSWSPASYIKASNIGQADKFGSSISVSQDGTVLSVGAFGEGSSSTGVAGEQLDNSATQSGAVYIFSFDGLSWQQQAYIKASEAADTLDSFGISSALSDDGSQLVVGAYLEDSSSVGLEGNHGDNSSEKSGAVYSYYKDSNGSWTEGAYVKAPNTDTDDRFGRSLALSGDGSTLAVGSVEEQSSATGIGGNIEDNSTNKSGAVYLY